MVKVKMPRAEWEMLLMILDDYQARVYSAPLINSLHKEISDQVYSQEY
jgi:hypothetical protein